VRLHWLALHWERLARRDPFFAVLTDVNARFGQSDLDAFYRSGTEEIAAVLGRAGQRGLAVPLRRALDFGCGVGRLTHALAERFDRCDGVDISAAMLDIARRHCRRPDRCTFHRNVSEDLAIFDDASFTFVYSTLVLQHMPPRLSMVYVREMIRVLASDGLLVFQLPSHREAREPIASDVRTAMTGPLPHAACDTRLSVDAPRLSGHGGQPILLPVRIENRSPVAWPALPDSRGRYQLNVANHWLDEHGQLVQRDDARSPPPFDVEPGMSAEVILAIRPPLINGRYMLEVDLVQENVCWFAERGSQPLRLLCEVTGGLETAARSQPSAVVPPPPAAAPPFRKRHPGAYAVLDATGFRDVYWRTRRAIDRVKLRRDSAIRRWLHPIVHERIQPFIQRRVNPLINRWNGVSLAARMEMHCVPETDVSTAIHECGGRLVAIDEEMMAGGYHSRRYWVTKRPADR
jgi:SAM-dependent methyltransferase